MKKIWQRYAERIDAATTRERALMFGAAVLIVVAALHSLFLEPQLREQRRLAGLQAARLAEAAKLQAELQKIASGHVQDPNVEARKRLIALRAEIETLGNAIVEQQKKFTAPDQMGAVLSDILTRNGKLRLVDMKTLPPQTLSEGRPQPAPKPAPGAPATSAGGAERLIYQHGLEITLSGTYLDMLAYLTALENLPSQMYWGSMDLNVAEYPTATLKVVVYTLSLDRAWMLV